MSHRVVAEGVVVAVFCLVVGVICYWLLTDDDDPKPKFPWEV